MKTSFISNLMENKRKLRDILSEDNKIVIPDLQRDYCWADRELVKQFIDGLIAQFNSPVNRNKELNMGLLYWYRGLNAYWLLCDGQQRITTLFLCLGVLNKQCDGNPFADLLISSFELHEDDKEPRLQYAIRESSLYFLSDLVCEYFLSDKQISSDEIKSQPWYYREYDFDPSIQNYLRAINTIERSIDSIESPLQFGDYLADKLEFYCYDMGSRVDGEETFVVINTTGEPLTPTENLKPHIIESNKDTPGVARKWEDIENYFWKNRPDGNDTSDPGLNEFLKILSLHHYFQKKDKDAFDAVISHGLNDFRFDFNEINFEEIQTFLSAYKICMGIVPLIEWNPDQSGLHQAGQSVPYTNRALFSLLPTIRFVITHNETSPTSEDIRRVHHMLFNITRYRSIGTDENSTTVWDGLELIDKITTNDIADLVIAETIEDARKTVDGAKLPTEERTKLFVLSHCANRAETEIVFAQAENYWLFDGEISNLVVASIRNNQFSLEHFNRLYLNTRHLWLDYDGSNLLRRALMTLGLEGYPREYRGGASSMGRHDDWKSLYQGFFNNADFYDFLNDAPEDESLMNQYLLDKVDHFTDSNSTLYPLISRADLIEYCEYHYVYIGEHILILNPKLQSDGWWRYIFDGSELIIKNEDGFYRGRLHEKRCLYTDHLKYNIAIDLIYHGTDAQTKYEIDVFERDNSGKPNMPSLFTIVQQYGLQEEMGRMRYHSNSLEDTVDLYCKLHGLWK